MNIWHALSEHIPGNICPIVSKYLHTTPLGSLDVQLDFNLLLVQYKSQIRCFDIHFLFEADL